MSKTTKAITCQAYEKIKLMRQMRINCRETQGTWEITTKVGRYSVPYSPHLS